MRKTIISLVALACLASLAHAGSRYVSFTATIGATAGVTNTQTRPIKGSVNEVYVVVPENFTGDVYFASAPGISTDAPETVIYTNAALTASAVARPRVVPTDNEGSDLSSLTVAEPLLLTGDQVTFSVIQASELTNTTVSGWLKIQD